MEAFVIDSDERVKIFKVLSEYRSLSFNSIVKYTTIKSNKLSYQLNLMVEKRCCEKDCDSGEYFLSFKAKQLIPYFSQIFKKEVGVLPVILAIVRHEDRILLIKREKMPYKDHWGLIGGKQINGETIADTIEREVFEEANLKAKFERCNSVVYERAYENDECKHSFLFIITTLTAENEEILEQKEGEVRWFDFNDVINGKFKDLIPTDVEFLKKYSNEEIKIDHFDIKEEGEKLILG